MNLFLEREREIFLRGSLSWEKWANGGRRRVKIDTSGQSYKHFTIVIYDPRVVIWGIFKSGTTLES